MGLPTPVPPPGADVAVSGGAEAEEGGRRLNRPLPLLAAAGRL